MIKKNIMAEEQRHHPSAASTAAPPTGKGGIGIAHAAATSVGSSGGDAAAVEDAYDAEAECEPCPKVSAKSSRKGGGVVVGGGGGIGGLDCALRAERGSPYAKPRKEGGWVSVGRVFSSFSFLLYPSTLVGTPLFRCPAYESCVSSILLYPRPSIFYPPILISE